MTTIITLVVLVSLGKVLVDGQCQTNGGPIDNCCSLAYNNNNYNVKSSLLVTFVKLITPILEYTVTLPQEEEGGLSLKGEKIGVLIFFNRDWV